MGLSQNEQCQDDKTGEAFKKSRSTRRTAWCSDNYGNNGAHVYLLTQIKQSIQVKIIVGLLA